MDHWNRLLFSKYCFKTEKKVSSEFKEICLLGWKMNQRYFQPKRKMKAMLHKRICCIFEKVGIEKKKFFITLKSL